jgi:hypothetical protein
MRNWLSLQPDLKRTPRKREKRVGKEDGESGELDKFFADDKYMESRNVNNE